MNNCCNKCSPPEKQYQAVLIHNGTEVFSPWIERKGDYLRATLDVVHGNTGTALEVRLYSKNKDDSGDGSEVDASTYVSTAATGRITVEWGSDTGTGLKELVRYWFSCGGSPGATWIVFRMLSPVWFDAVRTLNPP